MPDGSTRQTNGIAVSVGRVGRCPVRCPFLRSFSFYYGALLPRRHSAAAPRPAGSLTDPPHVAAVLLGAPPFHPPRLFRRPSNSAPGIAPSPFVPFDMSFISVSSKPALRSRPCWTISMILDVPFTFRRVYGYYGRLCSLQVKIPVFAEDDDSELFLIQERCLPLRFC